MKRNLLAVVPLLILCGCQTAPGRSIALTRLSPATSLTVTLPEIPTGQPIPERFSNYGANDIPTVQWSPPPTGTKSMLLLVEDPDAPGDTPYLHYLVINIPPATTSLSKSLPRGVTVGKNSSGEAAYFGPRPPAGVHHYHFEVLALDVLLLSDTGNDRSHLLKTIAGHVLAGGEAVATYEKR